MKLKKYVTQYVLIAAMALTSAAAAPAQADEVLARMLEAAAGRFFVTQATEGTEIASRVLSRPVASQSDYEELLARIRSNRISPEDARILNERVRNLNDRVTGDVESMSNEDLLTRLRPVSEAAGIALTERAAAGEIAFLPERLAEGTLATNSTAFLESASAGRRALTRFEFDAEAVIASADREKVAEIAQRYGAEGFNGHNYAELVDHVFKGLRFSASASHEAALEASDKLARMGEELEPMIRNLPREAQRGIRYTIADGVLSLEEFKPSEFTAAETHPLTNKRVGYVSTDEYPRYVESFVHNTAPYSTHPFSQGSGVLSIQDMRDIASHNMWPLELAGHDFRHVHYALSHPRALAVYFKSARSIDPMRFTLVSAMYEGVDTVQYGHESALARYFDQQMHMDLEEAMVYLGKASRSEMARISQEAGITDSANRFSQQIAGWRPTYASPYSPAGRGGHGLDADLDDMMKEFLDYAKNPAHRPFLQYNRRAVAGQEPLANDDSIQHY